MDTLNIIEKKLLSSHKNISTYNIKVDYMGKEEDIVAKKTTSIFNKNNYKWALEHNKNIPEEFEKNIIDDLKNDRIVESKILHKIENDFTLIRYEFKDRDPYFGAEDNRKDVPITLYYGNDIKRATNIYLKMAILTSFNQKENETFSSIGATYGEGENTIFFLNENIFGKTQDIVNYFKNKPEEISKELLNKLINKEEQNEAICLVLDKDGNYFLPSNEEQEDRYVKMNDFAADVLTNYVNESSYKVDYDEEEM